MSRETPGCCNCSVGTGLPTASRNNQNTGANVQINYENCSKYTHEMGYNLSFLFIFNNEDFYSIRHGIYQCIGKKGTQNIVKEINP
jgi:hypothetical protein